MGILSSITGNGIIGGITSLFGGIQQSRNINKMIKAQQEEQEKNREYNLMLAQQQNAWNEEQWERETNYDSPSNQISRLVSAGLSPDLAYGSGSVSNLAATSPEMSAGAPSQPVDMSALAQKPTVGQMLSMAADNALKMSAVEKTNAETLNIKSNTKGQDINNFVNLNTADAKIALAKGEVELQNGTLKLQRSTLEVNDATIKQLQSTCNNLDASTQKLFSDIDVNRSKIQNMDTDTVGKKIDNALKEPMAKATINKLAADAHLSYVDAEQVVKESALRVAGLDLNNQEISLRNGNLQIDYQQKKFDFSSDQKFKNVERGVNMATSFVNCLSKAAATVLKFVVP